MFVNAKFLIDSDLLNQQDQTLRLAGLDWADYEQLLSEECPGDRVSFLNGVTTLIFPRKIHIKHKNELLIFTQKLSKILLSANVD